MKLQQKQDAPLPLFLLKSIVLGLGIVLVAGFVYVMGIILLGGKYFTEKAEFSVYALERNITLDPFVVGDVISAKTSPLGVEVLHKTDKGLMLSVYGGIKGDIKSEILISKEQP